VIWQAFATSTAATEWYAGLVRSRPPPSAFRVEPVERTYGRVLDGLSREFTGRLWPGGLELSPEDVPIAKAEEMQSLIVREVYRILEYADERRRPYHWEDLDDDERPPQHVVHEVATELAGMRAVGPGGRAVVQRLDDTFRASIAVRRTIRDLGGTWVPAATMGQRFGQLFAGPAPDVRVRAGFGYHELSLYAEQRVVRPAIVVIIDRPFAETGPRWRVVHVEPATHGDDGFEDPDAAGIGDDCQ
jgi:hypothetical protein